MSQRTRSQALWLCLESTFGTDPDADGSDYTPVRLLKLEMVQDGTVSLPTEYPVAQNSPTAHDVGASGATLSFDVPLVGLATLAGDAGSPPADDVIDLLLNNAFGDSSDTDGDGCDTGTGASQYVTDTLTSPAPQDLACLWETGWTACQWRTITAESPAKTFAISPNFSPTPTAAAIAYGSKQWGPPSTFTNLSLAAYVEQDGTGYTLLGGRITSLKISAVAGQRIVLSVAMIFDSIANGTKGSRPAVTTFSTTPLKAMLSPVLYDGSALAVKSVEIDFGLSTVPIDATSGTNGRATFEVVRSWPTITLTPLYAAGFETSFRAGTTAQLIVQFGAGVVVSTLLNSLAFHAEECEVVAPAPATDDQGVMRQSVQLRPVWDGANYSGAQKLWRLGRA